MDSVRYYAALFISIMAIPSVLVWFVVHPFAARWRRVGPVVTYLFIIVFVALGIASLWSMRRLILAIDFGFNRYLTVAAAIFWGCALFFRIQWRQQLRPKTLLGIPEVSGRRNPEELVTDGIYSRIRHPRYIEMGMVLAAVALFSNYLAAYVVVALYVPLIYIVVMLEERELRDRFGGAYEEYCSRVPRFFPRFGRRGIRRG